MGKKSSRALRETSIEKNILDQIKKYDMIRETEQVVCAVSGGPDSMAMLDMLHCISSQLKLGFEFGIVVAHVNHKIRKESDQELKYVEKYCSERNIQFFSKEIDIEEYASRNKLGTEEAGRNVRYEFFDYVMEKTNSNKIAIAHNKNDKAETMLLNIIRGTGLNGLKGIMPVRQKYIRPILNVERYDIEEYTKDKELKPKIDSSNSLDIYSRNKIRNKIMPYIKEEFNPNIIQTLDRLSSIVTEQEEYIAEKSRELYDSLIVEETENQKVVLDLKKFNVEPKVLRKKVILMGINTVKGNIMQIEQVNIEDIIKMCEKNIGKKYLEPIKNIKIAIEDKKILIFKV